MVLLKSCKQIPIEIVLNIVQKELCLLCPVYEYKSRNCKNCPNNLEERLKDENEPYAEKIVDYLYCDKCSVKFNRIEISQQDEKRYISGYLILDE